MMENSFMKIAPTPIKDDSTETNMNTSYLNKLITAAIEDLNEVKKTGLMQRSF